MNGNLFVEVFSRKQAENELKMKTFHATKYRAYQDERLNTSQGVTNSRELALATRRWDSTSPGKTGSYKHKKNLN